MYVTGATVLYCICTNFHVLLLPPHFFGAPIPCVCVSLSLPMGRAKGAEPASATLVRAIIFYCLCSGSMLLVNKLAVSHLPSPAIVTISQFASASILIHLLKWLNVIQVDELEWSRGKYFLIYVALFSIGTWTNMKVLAIANVEVFLFSHSNPFCPYVTLPFFPYITGISLFGDCDRFPLVHAARCMPVRLLLLRPRASGGEIDGGAFPSCRRSLLLYLV